MGPPRLSSLGTTLRSATGSYQTSSLAPFVRSTRSPAQAAAFFHTSRERAQAPPSGRYGSAKQPPKHLKEEERLPEEDDVHDRPPTLPDNESEGTSEVTTEDAFKGIDDDKGQSSTDPIALPPPSQEAIHAQHTFEAAVKETAEQADKNDALQSQMLKTPNMDRVLDVDSPEKTDAQKPPHLQPPPYVHHFDTWSLVRDLNRGSFSEQQAVGLMKAVRGVLGENVDLARRALVSKSNVENVSFSGNILSLVQR